MRIIANFNDIMTGGKHHRFKRGYKNVIDEAIRLVRFGYLMHGSYSSVSNGPMVSVNILACLL